MKKIILLCGIVLKLHSACVFGQEAKKTPTGLGIDAGMGYNMMTLEAKNNVGEDTVLHYNRFWMQPCLRLHYDINILNFGTSNSLKVKTFLGYYSFGGKLKINDKGEYNIIAMASIEAGAGLSVDIIKLFQVSPLIKAQYVISATERYIRETSKEPDDVKSETFPFSYNIGLQLRFKYKHFTVSAEGWYGLADFHKSAERVAKENNVRLLIGYEF